MVLIIASGLLSVWRTYSEDRLMRGSGPVVVQNTAGR
jgi:S-adenosylmethionine uptake transporter